MVPLSNSPEFSNPPVSEVVCGVRFSEPLGIGIGHIGLLWQELRSSYPIQHQVAPIDPRPEMIEWGTGFLFPRTWFLNQTDDKVVQIQKDRFIFNWRKGKNNSNYPRFRQIFLDFTQIWNSKILPFLERENIPLKPIIEFELSYVNHIEITDTANLWVEHNRIFSVAKWARGGNNFLPEPEQLRWSANYSLPNGWGYLNVGMTEIKREPGLSTLLQLQLSARGVPNGAPLQKLQEWYEMAHSQIVWGFVDITEKDAQKSKWGRNG